MNTENSEAKSYNKENPSTFVATVPRTKKFISKRFLAYLVKIVIAVLVMVMVLKRVQTDEIFSAFHSAKLSLIFLALMLLIPNIYLQFFKWRYLIRMLKPEVKNREVLNSLLAGFTFGFITPGRLGEFGRAFFIKDCSWVKLLGIAAIDKLFSLAVVVFWGAIGLMFFIGHQLYLYTLIPVIIFTVIALLVIYYILFHPEIIKGFLYSLNVILPVRDKIKLLMSSLDNFHKRQALTLLFLNLCFYSIFLFQFFILTGAFESAPFFPTLLAISSALLVKSMLPISIGDLGIRESAAIFFLGKVGLLNSTAFNASILLFLINLLIPSVVGLVLVLKYRLFFVKNNLSEAQ